MREVREEHRKQRWQWAVGRSSRKRDERIAGNEARLSLCSKTFWQRSDGRIKTWAKSWRDFSTL
jgi:hypothetical protein